MDFGMYNALVTFQRPGYFIRNRILIICPALVQLSRCSFRLLLLADEWNPMWSFCCWNPFVIRCVEMLFCPPCCKTWLFKLWCPFCRLGPVWLFINWRFWYLLAWFSALLSRHVIGWMNIMTLVFGVWSQALHSWLKYLSSWIWKPTIFTFKYVNVTILTR